MMLEINPYSIEKCQSIVESDYITQLKNKYGSEYSVYNYRKYYTFDNNLHRRNTPRLGLLTRVIPCASFYYLDYLVRVRPTVIGDVGCGINFFKDIIPGIVGIDGYGDYADIIDMFDNNFSIGHTDHFDCAFSIDALHFVSISYFYDRIMQFANIIKPGGRGYIAMNVARLLDFTSVAEKIKIFNTKTPTPIQLATYIDQQIKKITLQLLVVDNLILDCYDEYIDGNIRIVFEK
jgi:hypothetical protein